MKSSEGIGDWLGTFWRILVSPSPGTFLEEAEKAENKLSSALGWAVFTAIYSYVTLAIAGYLFSLTVLALVLLIFPLLVALMPSAAHFVLQRVFQRKQYLYDKVLYIYTAILVIFQLISVLVFFLPASIASFLTYLLLAYQFVLLVIATKAIAAVNYGQALLTVLSAVVVGALIFACTLPLVSSLLGAVTRTSR